MNTDTLIAVAPMITFLLGFLVGNRATKPFATLVYLSGVIIGTFSIHKVPAVYLSMTVLSLLGWIFYCLKLKVIYKYDERIYSLSPDRNKNRPGRVLGRCLPYCRSQIRYGNSTIVQSDTALRGGTIITGSSGSGKTYSIKEMIKQDLDQGKPVVFFNFKGDKETEDDIADSAKCKVYRMNGNGCNFTYDPLINLDNAGRAEAILNMKKWSITGVDDHYKTNAMLLLQKTIAAYEHKEGNYLLGYYNYLLQLKSVVPSNLSNAYETVIKLLELTITSNVGKVFHGDEEEFRFDQKEPYVMIVSFTSATKALGTSITSLMFRDLMETGTRVSFSPMLCLYVDEFGSCESPVIVKDILEKGRSCGIATVLAMQDLNQLIINTNAPFLDSVLGTVNNYIIHQGCTKETASKISGVQISELEDLLLSLKKPYNGKPPTVMYISKYPVFGKGGTEVYRYVPMNKGESVRLEDIKGDVTSFFNDVAGKSLKELNR